MVGYASTGVLTSCENSQALEGTESKSNGDGIVSNFIEENSSEETKEAITRVRNSGNQVQHSNDYSSLN